MMGKIVLAVAFILLGFVDSIKAQQPTSGTSFTKDDTLRGALNKERNWWNVLHYFIDIQPKIDEKTISGRVDITFSIKKQGSRKMQIDLQQPLVIDSVRFGNNIIAFTKIATNVWHLDFSAVANFTVNSKHIVNIYYHGKPREAVHAPWDGGWIWAKDTEGSPWITVAVQGLGASAWYPCKDHQSDEPELGAGVLIAVPDTLKAIANGTLVRQTKKNGLVSFEWKVKNPINNYCIVPYIGKYTSITDTFMGEKGKLSIQYWVLNSDLNKAKEQFKQVKPMLKAFEYWFGPYPFYEDGYQLIQAPHLGMEHQSAVAYGNKFKNGYLGRDLSGSGWGLKWDFIIVHESGHEWFANNITTNDIADMWVHEGFTNYSETLFTEYYYGKKAANDYCFGIRKNIKNDKPITGFYGVNNEGSGDMYYKAANMIHAIRNGMNNDSIFRHMLRMMNKKFYHSTVNAIDIQKFINKSAKFSFDNVFKQYLTTTQIPVLKFFVDSINQKLYYKYSECVKGFNLPIVLADRSLRIYPNDEKWQWLSLKMYGARLWDPKAIEYIYYLKVTQVPALQ